MKAVVAHSADASYKGLIVLAVLCSLFVLLGFSLPAHGSARQVDAQGGLHQETTASATEGGITTILWDDIRAIATAPLHIGKVKDLTWRQVAVGLLIIGGIAGVMTVDEDIRAEARDMDDDDADLMQNVAGGVSLASMPLLYGVGMWKNEEKWRLGAFTAAESTLVAFVLAHVVKNSTGRERPDANRGAHEWYNGEDSFVSDVATYTFATAEGVSAAVDHRWWVTIPSYAFGVAVGAGRMGLERHWASDIAASAVLGVGTAKLFEYLHATRRLPGSTSSVAPVSFSGGGMGLRWHLGF